MGIFKAKYRFNTPESITATLILCGFVVVYNRAFNVEPCFVVIFLSPV